MAKHCDESSECCDYTEQDGQNFEDLQDMYAGSNSQLVQVDLCRLRDAVAHVRGQYEEQKQRAEQHLQDLRRVKADYENFRKRTERQQKEKQKRAKVQAVRTLLPSLDNLNRVLTATDDEDDPIRKGVEMIMRQIQGQLQSLGITRIQAQGEPFDPEWHEAVEHVYNTDQPEGTVTEEVQPGYRLDDILVRAAKVKVARSPKCQCESHDKKDVEIEN